MINDPIPICLVDADTDGLEDELRFLLENSSLDEPSTLPEVPSHPLSPVREFGSLCDDLLSALPSVPQTHFNITDDELDKERSRITLADTGMPGSCSFIFQMLPQKRQLK